MLACGLETIELIKSQVAVDWLQMAAGVVLSGISAYLCIHTSWPSSSASACSRSWCTALCWVRCCCGSSVKAVARADQLPSKSVQLIS
ncbi:hypothetical protein ULF88_09175 [Halopseudomonas pachastrellae]|nr:hypothetical protein [Halopseudomonas pachastrellae]